MYMLGAASWRILQTLDKRYTELLEPDNGKAYLVFFAFTGYHTTPLNFPCRVYLATEPPSQGSSPLSRAICHDQ